ncbi:MAG: YdbH domain-containing protein [Alphaproteobacteria bacterium]
MAEKTARALTGAGFPTAALPPPETKFGQITYNGIKLDKDGFSRINRLTLKARPLSFILGKHPENLQIKDIELTGELNENGTITIAGWNGALPALQNAKSKPRIISIENMRISLLSEKWGGISLHGDIQITPSGNNTGFQARLKAAQKRLNADASIEGQITGEGFWDARIEIEQGKFELGAIKTSRLAGLIKLNGNKAQDTEIIGELESGGLNILGMPWQNGAITIDGNLQQPRMILAAKSSGHEGLELGLTTQNIHTPEIFSGQIHALQLASLFDYLESQNHLPVKRQLLTPLDPLASITVQFSHKKNLVFKINNDTEQFDIKGKVSKAENNIYEIETSSDPIPLSSLPGIKTPFGAFTLSGKIKQNAKNTEGHIKIGLTNASLNYGALPLKNINASIPLDNLAALSGPPAKDAACDIPGVSPAINCKFSIQIKNAKPILSNLRIKGPGLSLSAPQAPAKAEEKTLLSVKTIDIKELLGTFENKAWNGAGLMTGTLTLGGQDNGPPVIDNLHLKNQGIGILKITDPKLFELMDMEELEKETMKLALENFHYDLLEIKAAGTFPDQIKISVFGKGKTPGLLEDRTFSMSFELTPDLAPLIAKLFAAQDTP